MEIDWQAWEYLLGEWDGGNVGDPGQGHGRFSFSFDLDHTILVRKSRTVYPDTLQAKFEMAPPGKPGAFFTYLAGLSRRIKSK